MTEWWSRTDHGYHVPVRLRLAPIADLLDTADVCKYSQVNDISKGKNQNVPIK